MSRPSAEVLAPPEGESLPIDPLLPRIVEHLLTDRRLVLEAPPGAGKTTRVPPALVAGGLEGRILVLEPRRIAARAAARRIADEWGWEVGRKVGYQVRFERRAGRDTRILAVTQGILLRILQGDPFLEGIGAILFDEFHERTLDADLALAMARRVREEARPELAIGVLSATLDPGPIRDFLDGAPGIESEGRVHPVTVTYRPREERERLEQAMAREIRHAARGSEGDVLAFLPGVGEIHRTADALETTAREERWVVLPLHGSLSPDDQDTVLRPMPRRKIVLATNVAETSITVPGVTAVVDSGLAKILRYDPGAGLDRLEMRPISRASAAQRAGRAGRERPGLCVRLWSEHDHRGRPERQTPEIRRVDLTGAALQLLAWGEPDLEAFPWFEEPNPQTLEDSLRLLELLDAVGSQGVTTLGKTLARFPAPPRIARLLVEGHSHGYPGEAARLGALLAERDPFPRRRDRSPAPARSDLWPRLEALERFRNGGHAPETPYGRLRRGPAHQVLRASRQLRRILDEELGRPPEPALGMEEALTRSLLAAYPDRLARRREPRSERVVLAGNRGARIGRGSAVRRGELLLALDLAAGRRGRGSEAWIRLATSVEREWLPTTDLEETTEYDWEEDRQRVVGRKRIRFGDLVLEEQKVPIDDPERAADVLIGAAEEDLETALGLDRKEVRRFLARVRNLAEWRPELELPRFEEEEIRELLPALARGKRSFRALREAPLVQILSGTLTFEQREALEREAPERIEVPSGSRVRLRWTEGEPPVLPVRIQELFGLNETPRVAGGRIPVLLHLLAPNMRPQQITDDLPGFWDRTYPEVRKELAGRYPKHSWPEDPRNARPERK